MDKVIKERDMLESAEALSENPIQLERSLTHDETLRASALSIACRYYTDTIVKDGDLYRELMRDNKVLKPATFIGVIETAFAFEAYIRGDLQRTSDAIVEKDSREPLAEINTDRPSQESAPGE